MAGSNLANARWWAIRRAQNRKPATYRCPLCGRHLPADRPGRIAAPGPSSEPGGPLSRHRAQASRGRSGDATPYDPLAEMERLVRGSVHHDIRRGV